MSHFTVAVFTDDANSGTWEAQVEALLAPYQENNMGDCPKEYLQFFDMEAEMEVEWETNTLPGAWIDGKFHFRWSDEFKKSGLPETEVPVREVYTTFEVFAKDYHGYKEKDPETGRYGYWENPNSKWDWYSIGGRWQGLLKVKSDVDLSTTESGELGLLTERDPNTLNVSSALLKDLDFEGMLEDARKKRREAWKKASESVYPDNIKLMLYGIKPDDTLESYVGAANAFGTFAAITPDGAWSESGQMGWWGIVSNENAEWPDQFAQILDAMRATPTMRITIVDCHI